MDTEDGPSVSPAPLLEEHIEEDDSLAKESCHDSGIDIRDTNIPIVAPVPTKKVRLFYLLFLYIIDYLLLNLLTIKLLFISIDN